MYRRPKHSKIEVVAPKGGEEEEEFFRSVLPKMQVRGALASCPMVLQCLRNVNKYLPVMRL
jgi:hypothetical protein